MNKVQIKGRMHVLQGNFKDVTGILVSGEMFEKQGRRRTSPGKDQAGYPDFMDEQKKDHRPRKSRSHHHDKHAQHQFDVSDQR